MEKVESDIAAVEAAISQAEEKLTGLLSENDEAYWRQEKLALRQEKHDLRQKELALINSQAPGMFMMFPFNSCLCISAILYQPIFICFFNIFYECVG